MTESLHANTAGVQVRVAAAARASEGLPPFGAKLGRSNPFPPDSRRVPSAGRYPPSERDTRGKVTAIGKRNSVVSVAMKSNVAARPDVEVRSPSPAKYDTRAARGEVRVTTMSRNPNSLYVGSTARFAKHGTAVKTTEETPPPNVYDLPEKRASLGGTIDRHKVRI
jgi:hypothetical protein